MRCKTGFPPLCKSSFTPDAMNLESYNYGAGFWDVADKYGFDAAQRLAEVAATGDQAAFNIAISRVRRGEPFSTAPDSTATSTWGNFWHQITTDPLGAPLDSANNQLKQVFLDLLKNPFVLVALALGLFFAFGGADFIRRKMNP